MFAIGRDTVTRKIRQKRHTIFMKQKKLRSICLHFQEMKIHDAEDVKINLLALAEDREPESL